MFELKDKIRCRVVENCVIPTEIHVIRTVYVYDDAYTVFTRKTYALRKKLNEKCTFREVILFVKKVWREVSYEERKCVACLSPEQKPRRYK